MLQKKKQIITHQIQKNTTVISKSLYQAIIRIQAEEDLDFDKACEVTGTLVDHRQKDFEKAVKVQVDKRYKSELMKQVNKAKQTIGGKKYLEGYEDGCEKSSNRFKYPCSICDEPISLSNNSWESASQFLTEKGWHHRTCGE